MMAAARSQTPSHDLYAPIPAPSASHISRGYGASVTDGTHLVPGAADASDFAQSSGQPAEMSPLSQSLQTRPHYGKFEENFDASQRGSSILDGDMLHRSASTASTLNQGATPSRSGTLKKKNSLSRRSSLKRSGSRRSLHAGSITGVKVTDDGSEQNTYNNVFYTPVPTTGTPTEILANRFQAWRKLLKDLITYFREVQASYEHRSKALLKVSNVINNTNAPSVFLSEGGLNDANRILRDYHKQAVVESNKARDIENDVIIQLSGLRADLAQKIKEIKGLSGDFKNSVEKEKEGTRRVVAALNEALAAVDVDPTAVTGKGDPYVVRLAVDRQIEKQIDEENYLHRAYLNLEGSGRELESIVVGEIQKAYNALASILKRDADEAYSTVEKLRTGPVSMPRDLEWTQFVENDSHFVNPRLPLRQLEDIEYPGKHHPAAAEVRAGMLERKSKYLKSYTPGWYVLSPTHLHEFKSADRIYTQPPVMSLYLPDQKLGSHSQPGSSSHKFMLKGRQTGSMHRGHSWVFRAESYDTMMAWYEDIKILTEKRGEERNAFVRRHTRSISAGSNRSVSDDSAIEEDEADQIPYSGSASLTNQATRETPPQRPSPGGRFPSDIQVNHGLPVPPSPSSGTSEINHDLTTASGGFQANPAYFGTDHYVQDTYEPILGARETPSHIIQPIPIKPTNPQPDGVYAPLEPPQGVAPTTAPHHYPPPTYNTQPAQVPTAQSSIYPSSMPDNIRHNSMYGDWMAPVARGTATGAVAGATVAHVERDHKQKQEQKQIPVQQPTNNPPTQTNLASPAVVGSPIATSDPGSLTSAVSSAPTSLSNTPNELPTGAYASSNDPNPTLMRKGTDMSVSDLHVPGEFPKIISR